MTRAEEWRAAAVVAARAEAVELELPSGTRILARRPTLMQLAEREMLPLSLAAGAGGAGADKVTNEQVAEMARCYRDLLIYCCVDPRVPDEMAPEEIPQQDWTFILSWALRVEEARALEGFRQQRPDAGGGGDGAAVREQTF